MRSRMHYEKLFASYPDVVTLPEFCNMLGGIGDSTARKLIRTNKVKHFYIRCTYPVSYTHLDVYKRQGTWLPFLILAVTDSVYPVL